MNSEQNIFFVVCFVSLFCEICARSATIFVFAFFFRAATMLSPEVEEWLDSQSPKDPPTGSGALVESTGTTITPELMSRSSVRELLTRLSAY